MLFWHEEPKRRARIELIPMIDVMMFLLIFFVLISLNVIPAKGLKTELPTSAQSTDLKPAKHVVLTISRNGDISMDSQRFSLTDVSQNLRTLSKSAHNVDVVINGDKGVDMQTLIDVMDAVKQSGINDISIATRAR